MERDGWELICLISLQIPISFYKIPLKSLLMEVNIIEDLKTVYHILYRLLALPESDWKTKIYVSTAIAYLINPYDVIPEVDGGEEGYIDDLYLCLLVLNDLNKYRVDLIVLANEEKINIDEFIKKIEIIKEEINDKKELIEEVSGYSSLYKLDISNSQVDSKISEQIKRDSTILGMIAFFYDELVNEIQHYEEIRKSRRLVPGKRHGYKRKIKISYHDNPFIQDLKESGEFFDVKRLCNQFHNLGTLDLAPSELDSRDTLFINYEAKLNNISQESQYYYMTSSPP